MLDGAAGGSALRDELLGLPVLERGPALRTFVADSVADVLQLSAAARERLDVHVDLSRIGIDSLMGLELRVGLERDLGVELPGTFLAEGPSIHEIAERLQEQLS